MIAKRLGRGLQNLLDRFDSDSRLQNLKPCVHGHGAFLCLSEAFSVARLPRHREVLILLEQEKRERHKRHPGDKAVEGVVPLAIRSRGRKKFVQTDKDHNPGNATGDESEE